MFVRLVILFVFAFARSACASSCSFAEQAEKSGKMDIALVQYLYCAEEENDTLAQHKLGTMFYQGIGLKAPDYRRAVVFFSKAAHNGYAPSQLRLGLLYWRGEGVVKNLILAHKWLYLAQEPSFMRWFYLVGPTSDRNAKSTFDQLNQQLTLDSQEVKEAYPFSTKMPLTKMFSKSFLPSYKEVSEFQHKNLTEAGEELLDAQGQKDLQNYMRRLKPDVEPTLPATMPPENKQKAIKMITDWFKPVLLKEENLTPKTIPVLNKLKQEIDKPI